MVLVTHSNSSDNSWQCCSTFAAASGIILDVLCYFEAAKTVAVLSGPPGHHLQSAGDVPLSVTCHATSVFTSHLTSATTLSNTQPVRFTASNNAVLLGAYGLAQAQSGPSGLPSVTLHPILQPVDTRQVAERLVGFYTTSLIHLPIFND